MLPRLDNLRPMPRLRPFLLAGALVVLGCKKEAPMLGATMQVTCRNCIVSRATGTAQSRVDTLIGTVVAPGDTTAVTRQWKVEMKDGDNVFLRACKLYPDTAFGTMELRVFGDIRSLQANGGVTDSCVTINQAGHKQ